MKKLILLIVLIFIALTSYAQEVQVQWSGSLKVQGSEFRIVFHVSKTNNVYVTTMDSPDQNALGIPVTLTNFSNNDVTFEISNIGMIYKGVLKGDKIAGTWQQAGQSFPLELVREGSKSK